MRDTAGGADAVLDRLVEVVEVGGVERDVRARDVRVELLALARQVADDGADVGLQVGEAQLVGRDDVRGEVVYERQGAQGHCQGRLSSVGFS